MNGQGKGKLLPTGKLGLMRDVSYDIIHEDSERKTDSGGTVKWKRVSCTVSPAMMAGRFALGI
jgi:hypothetical protein